LTNKAYVVKEGEWIGMAMPADKYQETVPPEPPPDQPNWSRRDGGDSGDTSREAPGLSLIPGQPVLRDGVSLLQPTGTGRDPSPSREQGDTGKLVPGLSLIPGQPVLGDGVSLLQPSGTGRDPSWRPSQGDIGRMVPGLSLIPGQLVLCDGVPLLQPTGTGRDPSHGEEVGDVSEMEVKESPVTLTPSALADGLPLIQPGTASRDQSPEPEDNCDEGNVCHIKNAAVSAGDTNISVPISAMILQGLQNPSFDTTAATAGKAETSSLAKADSSSQAKAGTSSGGSRPYGGGGGCVPGGGLLASWRSCRRCSGCACTRSLH
jgi:hypothetical protein